MWKNESYIITKYLISYQVALSKLFGCEIDMNVNNKVDYKLHECMFTPMLPLLTALKK